MGFTNGQTLILPEDDDTDHPLGEPLRGGKAPAARLPGILQKAATAQERKRYESGT